MRWRSRAQKFFPTHLPETTPRAKVPSVPGLRNEDEVGLIGTPDTLGTLASRDGSDTPECEPYDAHVELWYDYEERAAIIEFDGNANK